MITPQSLGDSEALDAIVREIDAHLADAISHDRAQIKRLTNLLRDVNHLVNEFERLSRQPSANSELPTVRPPKRASNGTE